jgi:hypothetical protein
MFKRVDLPEPEGPARMTKQCSSNVQEKLVNTWFFNLTQWVIFIDFA